MIDSDEGRREDVQWSVLGLLHALDGRGELALEHLVDEGRAAELRDLGTGGAIQRLAASADPTDPVERFWLGYAVSQAVPRRHEEDLELPLGMATVALLDPLRLPDPDRAATALHRALDTLRPGEPLQQGTFDLLHEAFQGTLAIGGQARSGTVDLSGTASSLATMLLELGTTNLDCDSKTAVIDVGGVPKEVQFVEVDVCTNRTFDSCKGSIDPLHWPAANPLFQSVVPISTPTTSGNDWAGDVRETVGPGINGKTYVTDLAITYLEREDLVIAAFDLADPAHPGEVTVDHGFLALSEEGDHRRIRTLKVYRIEDLQVPPKFICPLWSLQFAFAAWWGAL